MKKLFAALLALSMMFSMTALYAEAADSESPAEENIPVEILYDYVVQAQTITDLDYEYAKQATISSADGWGGRCSAAAKVLPDGDMVVGRNMDYFISNCPCIIVHTKDPEYHETYGITYNNSTGPTFEDVKANGLSPAYAKLMPFLVNDAMNEEGLYIEMDMRANEQFEDPADDYGCSGTNPESSERICEIMLPQLIALNCANIDEMLEYVHSIDIFTMSKGDAPFNLAFIVADASGRYGLLEIARNRISWVEGQPIQTNYYLTESFAANEAKKMGVGRYAILEKGLPDVQTEEDMYALMNRVSYFQMYFPATCEFDFRTELVEDYPEWDYDFVTDPANWGFMMKYMAEDVDMLRAATREEIQDMNKYWETTFNTIANCTKKTMRVRFFEDEEKVVNISFDAEELPDIPTEYKTADEWKSSNALSPHGVNEQLDSYDESRPAAKCLNGTFVGNMENDVAVWKGIPYAKAPVGNLRFKRAQDPENSDAIFDATYFGDSCLQPLSEEERSSMYGQSEDCLRLNVWNSSAMTDENKPVFVYIHGGGWASGGSSEPQYNGYNLAHYNPDIIVVTLSYRFNLMGLINLSSFLDGAEYETSVNNGVYDLIQALKWIKQNISAFGGDPENVTICGESAGGGAVSVLCLNEEARQYFQKAIPMSGSVSQPNTMDVTDKLPEALKADFGVRTVAELQQIPFETLQDWWSENQSQVYHLCVRDGKAISEDPFADWTNGVTKDLIILQGHTANEYQYYQHIYNDDADFFNAICSTTMETQLESGSEEFRAVFEDYKQALLELGYPEDSVAREYCNDRSLAIGNTYQATKHADNGGKGYFYIFEQPYDGAMAQYGAAHAIDCYYLFGSFEGNEAAGTKEEVDLSRRFQRMIANFCRTGDPSTEDMEWPAYTADDRCTMMIGPNMRVEKNPEGARVEAALKMVDLHEDFRYLKSFSTMLPLVQQRYPEAFEAFILKALNAE